jgi:hypothetical protein
MARFVALFLWMPHYVSQNLIRVLFVLKLFEHRKRKKLSKIRDKLFES